MGEQLWQRKPVAVLFSPSEYSAVLEEILHLAEEGRLSRASMEVRLYRYRYLNEGNGAAAEEASTATLSSRQVQFLFDRRVSYDYFITATVRETKSLRDSGLLSKENLLNVLKKPRLGLHLEPADLTLEKLMTLGMDTGIDTGIDTAGSNPENGPEESRSHAPAPLINHALRRQVREEMNKVYLGTAAGINSDIFSRLSPHSRGEILHEARHYFLALLIGKYEIIDKQYRLQQRSVQLAVERALCSYLGFHGGDHGFLLKSKDKDIALHLIGKVERTTYTNKEIARRAFVVLVGDKYRTMKGYEEFKEILESNDPSWFKDRATLWYINNRLKPQVVQLARIIYGVPEKD